MTTSPLPSPQSVPPPPKPPSLWDDKGNRIVLIGLLCGLILFLGSCAGLVAVGQATKTTTTANAAAPTYLSPPGPSKAPPSTAPPSTAGPTTTTTKAPAYAPTPADFTIEVIETRRACFGSAGCNVSYQVVPTYTGPALSPTRKFTVLFEVHGGEDVGSDSFTMKGTDASVPSPRSISMTQGQTLTATATRVIG